MKRRGYTKRQGYTLIELVVVLAIAGMMAAVLLPVFAQSPDERRKQVHQQRSQCMSNLKQIGLSMSQYTQDYDEKLPPASTSHVSAKDFVANRRPLRQVFGWVDLIAPYARILALFQCSADKHAAATDSTQPGYTDYWLNLNTAGKSIASVMNPSQTLLSGDGDGGSQASNARYAINRLPRAWLQTPGSPALRHLPVGGYAFVDGHVKMLAPQRVFTTKSSDANRGGGTFSIR